MRGSGRARCWECHCEDSSSLEQAGPPGEATRRSLGAEFCLRSWDSSWLKLENRFEALCSTLFLRRADCWLHYTQGAVFRAWWPLSHLLSLHGAVAQGLLLSYPMFTGGEISEIAAAPPRRRAPATPHRAPPRLSFRALCTSAPNRVPSRPGPTLFCTTSPSASSSCPALALPLCVPRSRKPSSRAAEPGSLQCASQRDGWGGGHN